MHVNNLEIYAYFRSEKIFKTSALAKKLNPKIRFSKDIDFLEIIFSGFSFFIAFCLKLSCFKWNSENNQPFNSSCLPLFPADLFWLSWLTSFFGTGDSVVVHPFRKTACVFKNPENADVGRKASFQVTNYLFNPNEILELVRNSSGKMLFC